MQGMMAWEAPLSPRTVCIVCTDGAVRARVLREGMLCLVPLVCVMVAFELSFSSPAPAACMTLAAIIAGPFVVFSCRQIELQLPLRGSDAESAVQTLETAFAIFKTVVAVVIIPLEVPEWPTYSETHLVLVASVLLSFFADWRFFERKRDVVALFSLAALMTLPLAVRNILHGHAGQLRLLPGCGPLLHSAMLNLRYLSLQGSRQRNLGTTLLSSEAFSDVASDGSSNDERISWLLPRFGSLMKLLNIEAWHRRRLRRLVVPDLIQVYTLYRSGWRGPSSDLPPLPGNVYCCIAQFFDPDLHLRTRRHADDRAWDGLRRQFHAFL